MYIFGQFEVSIITTIHYKTQRQFTTKDMANRHVK